MQSVLSHIGMLILPGALLIIVKGVIECRKTLAFVYLSLPTSGKIVEIKEEYEIRTKFYVPVIEFRLNKKGKFKFEAALKTRHKPNYKIGETVGVRYLLEKPEIARIDTFGQLYGSALSMIAAGGVFTLAALFLLGKLL
jgi:hypothetical protein